MYLLVYFNGEKCVVVFFVMLINCFKGMLIFDVEIDFVWLGVVVCFVGLDILVDFDFVKLCVLSVFIMIVVVLNVSVRFNSLFVSYFLMLVDVIICCLCLNILVDILCCIEVQVLGKLV